jgi:hypothetical protein
MRPTHGVVQAVSSKAAKGEAAKKKDIGYSEELPRRSNFHTSVA